MNNHSEEKPMVQLHAIITGDVQGVGFRNATRHFARQIGLVGTVENLSDGSVELFAYGNKEQVDKLIQLLLHKFGGQIYNISSDFSLCEGPLDDFRIV